MHACPILNFPETNIHVQLDVKQDSGQMLYAFLVVVLRRSVQVSQEIVGSQQLDSNPFILKLYWLSE